MYSILYPISTRIPCIGIFKISFLDLLDLKLNFDSYSLRRNFKISFFRLSHFYTQIDSYSLHRKFSPLLKYTVWSKYVFISGIRSTLLVFRNYLWNTHRWCSPSHLLVGLSLSIFWSHTWRSGVPSLLVPPPPCCTVPCSSGSKCR